MEPTPLFYVTILAALCIKRLTYKQYNTTTYIHKYTSLGQA